jgi:hypothetical protein
MRIVSAIRRSYPPSSQVATNYHLVPAVSMFLRFNGPQPDRRERQTCNCNFSKSVNQFTHTAHIHMQSFVETMPESSAICEEAARRRVCS